MKIAVFHELPPGGAKRMVDEYVSELGKKHHVDLYYISNTEEKIKKRRYGKNYFFQFKGKNWKGNDWKNRLYKDTVELLLLYKLHKKIAGIINSNNYDSFFIHPSRYTQSPFILRFLKKRTIYYCQEPLRIIYDDRFSHLDNIPFIKKPYEIGIRMLRKVIDRTNIRKANIVLANSNFSKKTIENAYKIKVLVCYLGIDTEMFRPQNKKKLYDIFFIGNKYRKGEYDLLKEVITSYHRKLNIKIIFRDEDRKRTSDKELVNIYNSSRLFLTITHNEPFGLTALEAMSCGIPVIAIKEGGYKESIKNNVTGILVERNKKNILNAIKILLENDSLRTEMGKQASQHIRKNWTIEKSANVLLSYLSLCNQKI